MYADQWPRGFGSSFRGEGVRTAPGCSRAPGAVSEKRSRRSRSEPGLPRPFGLAVAGPSPASRAPSVSLPPSLTPEAPAPKRLAPYSGAATAAPSRKAGEGAPVHGRCGERIRSRAPPSPSLTPEATAPKRLAPYCGAATAVLSRKAGEVEGWSRSWRGAGSEACPRAPPSASLAHAGSDGAAPSRKAGERGKRSRACGERVRGPPSPSVARSRRK